MSRKAAAYHEAGHVVVAWALGYDVQSACIDGPKGRFHACRPPHLEASDVGACEAECVIYRAGLVAERIHVGGGPEATREAFVDLQEIRNMAPVVEPENSRAVYGRVARQARTLLGVHDAVVIRVAEALLKNGRLERHELNALLPG